MIVETSHFTIDFWLRHILWRAESNSPSAKWLVNIIQEERVGSIMHA